VEVAGVEKKPIRFEKAGLRRAVSIPGVLDQAVEGVASAGNPNEPIVIDNTMHPVNPRVAPGARNSESDLRLRLSWSDSSGRNNGHFARFPWQGAAAARSIVLAARASRTPNPRVGELAMLQREGADVDELKNVGGKRAHRIDFDLEPALTNQGRI
jgi:hypothetical protein